MLIAAAEQRKQQAAWDAEVAAHAGASAAAPAALGLSALARQHLAQVGIDPGNVPPPPPPPPELPMATAVPVPAVPDEWRLRRGETPARRFPALPARLPSGGSIWGGELSCTSHDMSRDI